MKFTHLQKAKLILVLNFVILFGIIITTPYFIREGTTWASEETVEGAFLAVGLIALIIVFRHYDAQMRKKEEEAMSLNLKLEKKERELLNALEYLGKVNVQVSMIKSLLDTMKVPSTKSQLFEVFSEMLRIVNSVTKEEFARLRIINLKNNRTLSEHVEATREEDESCQLILGNKDLIEKFNLKSKDGTDDCHVFFSDAENFYLKAFIFVPNTKGKNFSPEEKMFIEAIANQCEVIFLLFNSQYFRNK